MKVYKANYNNNDRYCIEHAIIGAESEEQAKKAFEDYAWKEHLCYGEFWLTEIEELSANIDTPKVLDVIESD